MPAKKKGGKDKKSKGRMRKFDLDLFGILTFTRFHGAPFEEFMYSQDKKQQKGFRETGKGKNGKKDKKKKPVVVPRMPMFPPVPEDRLKDMKMLRKKKSVKDQPDVLVPTTGVGRTEKTTRPQKPFIEGGSIRDVICGARYPLPPRPLPHGGVYGDIKCMMCKNQGGLLKTVFGTLHKKMRKLLNTEFDRAQIIITWLTDKLTDMLAKYEAHMKGILGELSPVLDALDESEWDDHFEVRGLIDKWRERQRELDRLRAELKQFRKNREDEISKAVADKLKEFEDIERQLLALEKKIKEATENLLEWQENAEERIAGPEAAIAAMLERLRKIRESIFTERDTLRQLLGWEMTMATENTIVKMEEVIKEDLDILLGWMHPAWFRLFLENRKMQEERMKLRMENHLLELEVETLVRQVGQMEINQKEVENTRSYFITPPSLNERVDKFTRCYDDSATVQLSDYPNTRLVHE